MTLRSFVEAFEQMDEEVQEINRRRKNLWDEVRAEGWDMMVVKAVLAYRRDPDGSVTRGENMAKYFSMLEPSATVVPPKGFLIPHLPETKLGRKEP